MSWLMMAVALVLGFGIGQYLRWVIKRIARSEYEKIRKKELG